MRRARLSAGCQAPWKRHGVPPGIHPKRSSGCGGDRSVPLGEVPR